MRRVGLGAHVFRIAPPLALLLACDAFGELVGYAAGAGAAMRKLTADEFQKHRWASAPARPTT
jgi:hypothetical protein